MSFPCSSPCSKPTVKASPAPVASIWPAATASTCTEVAAAYASAPSLPRVTTTHSRRSPDTERTASNIPAEVTGLYCVSDPTTTVAGHAATPGTGGEVTTRADPASAASGPAAAAAPARSPDPASPPSKPARKNEPQEPAALRPSPAAEALRPRRQHVSALARARCAAWHPRRHHRTHLPLLTLRTRHDHSAQLPLPCTGKHEAAASPAFPGTR